MKKLLRNLNRKNESVTRDRTDSKTKDARKTVPRKKYWEFDFGEDPTIWWDDGWGKPLHSG